MTSGDEAVEPAEPAGHPAHPGPPDVTGAAVLLVEVQSGLVVQANPVARQLAPGVHLPTTLTTWSGAAGLDGEVSRPGDEPVFRAVTAARGSDLGPTRVPLGTVTVPLQGAPGLDSHALVVLVPLHTTAGDGSPAARTLVDDPSGDGDGTITERAALATTLSFTIADATAPDQPLVWVNPAFTAATGYELDDAIGRNCRFLQGPATDRDAVRRLRAAVDRREASTTTLLNYRKDGTPFWNQLDVTPVLDGDGRVTHFVGIQTDVTDRVAADLDRDRALEAERVAREVAETAQRRLRFLVDSVVRLSASLDVAEITDALVDLVLPDLADWALVLHLGGSGEVTEAVGAHADAERASLVEDLVAALPTGPRRGMRAAPVLQGSDTRRLLGLDRLSTGQVADLLGDASLADHATQLMIRSALVVALPGPGGSDDLLVLVRDTGSAPYDDTDVELARDIGRRAGLILHSARLLEAQTHIAETLQRTLLPDLPAPAGLTVAARYRAGDSGAEVGGDFYEVLDLPQDGVGLAIGDVAGHDIRAAAAMGHLQGLLRASAHRHYARPHRVLEEVDTMMSDLRMTTIATSTYGHLLRTPAGWRLRWSSAGHLPLVVRHADGSAELLRADDDAPQPMLGLRPSVRREHSLVLPVGTTLLGCTDGLVERRGETLDVGLARLLAVVEAAPGDVDGLCDHLLAELAAGHDDDIAVLALHLGDEPSPTGSADTGRGAR